MSGTIHINGKDYDEYGNLLPSKKQPVRFIDGMVRQNNIKSEPQKLKKVIAKKLAPVQHHRRDFIPIKPPTLKQQRSQTLLRSVVKKPTATMMDITSPTLIIKHKHQSSDNAHKYHKHQLIQRLAKVPSHAAIMPSRLQKSESLSFVPRKKTEEMIQSQLNAATAHLMTFKKPRIAHKVKKKLAAASPVKRRFVLSSASALMIVVTGGIIVYANLAGISLMIASKKAGFSAYKPTYTPSGYRIKNPIGYTPGRIIISFKSNTNDMNYSIEQKPSGWTNETLREQVSTSDGNQFQAQYVNGLTVYFTNDNNATWVDRGVLFTLRGDSGLSSEQIASIAASM